ncbi:unnamed protein product [Prorocentrum cordatum]|uniref:BED-type domain-containing protein n=1 Tax=Prorocentrum cordatum TaxID=2364126 RepID=A0ABN9Y8G0_9DINO|nr:unnamed protein product [Polarella glacialis]
MGKKRTAAGDDLALGGHRSQWWCYYCNTETKDEESLVRHQQSKHFRCTLCGPASPFKFCQSVSGLLAHVRRSHKMELTKVPGAVEGRDDVKVDVFAMRGIDGVPPRAAQAAKAAPPVMQPPPTPTTPEGMLAVLELHKQAEAKRQREAAEAASALQASTGRGAVLLAAAVGAGADASGPSLASAALGAIGSLSAAATGAVGAPLLGQGGGAAAAAPSAVMVWGKWRHSAGGEVTVTPGLAGLVIVSHAILGELTVPLSDFLQGSRVRFVEREGTLHGNLISWSNGTSWIKVL